MRISPILAGLMLSLSGISTSLAEVTYTTEAGGYILNSGSVTDDMVLTGSGSPTSVGSYHGPSTIVIEEGASLTTPNALFIGGKGYDTTGTSGGDGTIIVSKDATLTVGAENSNDGDGAHLDIGNSQYSCTGTLKIEGGTVNAKAGLVMGSLNAGYGVLEITNGGTLSVDKTGYSSAHEFQLINGEVNIDNGELSTTGDTTAYLGINGGSNVTINITNGGTYSSDGFNFVGYAGDATINVEGEDSSLEFSGVLQLGGGEGVGVVNIENGATVYGNSLSSWDTSSVSIAESASMSVTSVTLNGESTLTNNGTLEGYLEAGFGTTASGTGTFGDTSIQNGATLIIGTLNEDGTITAGNQTHTGSLIVSEGATLTFAIDDFNGTENSALILSEGSTLTVDEAAVVRLYLSEEAIEQSKTLGDDFSLELVNSTAAGETESYVLSNIEIYDMYGEEVEDIAFSGTVDENGNIIINTVIPEPATATLSLLALAAMVARRRR